MLVISGQTNTVYLCIFFLHSVNVIISDRLQKADLLYDDQEKCNSIYSEPAVRQIFRAVYPSGITNTLICASEDGRDACKVFDRKLLKLYYEHKRYTFHN